MTSAPALCPSTAPRGSHMRPSKHRTTALQTKTRLSWTCYPEVTPKLTLRKPHIPPSNTRPRASHTIETPQVPEACIQKNIRKPGDLRPTFDLQSLQVVPFTTLVRGSRGTSEGARDYVAGSGLVMRLKALGLDGRVLMRSVSRDAAHKLGPTLWRQMGLGRK